MCPPALIACATMRALARRGSVLVAVYTDINAALVWLLLLLLGECGGVGK